MTPTMVHALANSCWQSATLLASNRSRTRLSWRYGLLQVKLREGGSQLAQKMQLLEDQEEELRMLRCVDCTMRKRTEPVRHKCCAPTIRWLRLPPHRP